MEVPLLGVFVAGRAQFNDIRGAQQILEVGRVRIMAVRAVLEGRRMLHCAGKVRSIVAAQTLVNPLFLLKPLAEPDMRSVTTDTAEFFDGRMHDRLGEDL